MDEPWQHCFKHGAKWLASTNKTGCFECAGLVKIKEDGSGVDVAEDLEGK